MLLKWLCKFLGCCPEQPGIPGFILFGQTWKDGKMSKTIRMGDAASTATAHFTGKDGAEHPIFSVPAWAQSSTDGGSVTLTPAADGKTCDYEAAALGTVTITCAAECDETAGVNLVTLTASLTVAEEEDTGGTIDLG